MSAFADVGLDVVEGDGLGLIEVLVRAAVVGGLELILRRLVGQLGCEGEGDDLELDAFALNAVDEAGGDKLVADGDDVAQVADVGALEGAVERRRDLAEGRDGRIGEEEVGVDGLDAGLLGELLEGVLEDLAAILDGLGVGEGEGLRVGIVADQAQADQRRDLLEGHLAALDPLEDAEEVTAGVALEVRADRVLPLPHLLTRHGVLGGVLAEELLGQRAALEGSHHNVDVAGRERLGAAVDEGSPGGARGLTGERTEVG